MPLESVDPAIVRSFARRNTVEDLDTAIAQVAEAVLSNDGEPEDEPEPEEPT